ncbi:MAG: hypothetical protein ACOY3Z_01210 [Thermodesulfobacteriota bacterium]
MGLRRGLLVGMMLLFGAGQAGAEVITIDKEPPQLLELRKAREQELKSAVTAADIARAQAEHQQERNSLARVEGYSQKLAALDEAKKKELEAINAKYLKEQEKLDAATRKAIDEKHEKKLMEMKGRGPEKVEAGYVVKLEKLEKELIAKNDLAGALMVQNERRKVSGLPAVVAPAQAAAPAPQAAAPPKEKGGQVYVSSVRGLAGSEGNEANNVYSFAIERISGEARLVFHGYGNRSGNTYGTVFLIGPDGGRVEVAHWTPESIKGPKVSDYRHYTEVKPISADISSHLNRPGQYRVEFRYTEGEEAFNIYRVEIQVL